MNFEEPKSQGFQDSTQGFQESTNLKFKLFCDKKIQELLNQKEIVQDLEKIREQIEKILGKSWNLKDEIKVHLFSKREDYEEFIKSNFSERAETYIKDNAIFSQNAETGEKIIATYKPVELSEEDKKKLKEKGLKVEIIEERFKEMLKANILSAVAHEMSHLHPFFGGVGNENSPSKWHQEMVCIFIGEKIRTQYGNQKLKEELLRKAREEIKNKNIINLEEDGNDWEKINSYEFFLSIFRTKIWP